MDRKIENMLDDLRQFNFPRFIIIEALRRLAAEKAPEAHEQIKYGGFLFIMANPICGLFAYKNHATIEFSRGFLMTDIHGLLEGNGQFRRHIRLETVGDIERKKVGDYIAESVRVNG